MATALIDRAKQGRELRPCAVAMIHSIRVVFVVGSESLEQSVNRVVLNVELARRHQAAVLSKQKKDQPHQHCEQAGVDGIRVSFENLAKQLALSSFVGRLKPSQEFIERIQNLLR